MNHSAHMDHSMHLMHESDHSDIDPAISGHEKMDMDMDMDGMKMYFHFGVSERILFYGWQTSTVAGLIGSMIGIFLVSLLYEGLKYFREYLFRKAITANQYSTTSDKVSSDGRPVQYYDQLLLSNPLHILSPSHFLQTLLHMIQFIISYSLMLVFMTYNVWLCLACTLGAGVGYFLFGWKKSVVVDVTEHCH